MERLNAWNTYDLPMQDECMEFAKQYMNFLNIGKTERECVDFFVAEAEKNGYIELSRAISEKKQLKAGDCVYSVWMNKSMASWARTSIRPAWMSNRIPSMRTAASATWIPIITEASKSINMSPCPSPSTALWSKRAERLFWSM